MSAEDRVRYWQIRAHRAEAEAALRERDYEHLLAWFNERISRERHLSDRCTFLYGAAIQFGATHSDLVGPQ